MTTLQLSTLIQASAERCFDVSRDIQIHERSTRQTNERAVAGRTAGLCELHDEITWEATHFGIRQRLTVRITQLQRPFFFEDIMIRGAFKSMRHEHHFKLLGPATEMTDIFQYEVPFGWAGAIFDRLILKKYMQKFLVQRNEVIRKVCEKSMG